MQACNGAKEIVYTLDSGNSSITLKSEQE